MADNDLEAFDAAEAVLFRVPLNTRISETDAVALDALRARLGCSRSELIRRLIRGEAIRLFGGAALQTASVTAKSVARPRR